MDQGQIVRDLLQQHNIPVEEFASQYLQKSRAVAYNFLKKTEFSREELALMCLLFDKSPTYFGATTDVFTSPSNTGRTSTGVSSNKCLVYSGNENYNGRYHEKFLPDYYDLFLANAHKATNLFDAHHYLAKSKDLAKPNYLDQLQHFYLRLEDILFNKPGLRYRKVIALPTYINPNGLDLEARIKLSIRHIFPQFYRHILRCFLQMGSRFEFYSITFPSRLYDFSLIDNRIALTEYYRYNRFGKAKLDILFVEEYLADAPAGSHSNQIIKAYKTDFDNITQNSETTPRQKVLANTWYSSTHECQIELNNQLVEQDKMLTEFNLRLLTETMDPSAKSKLIHKIKSLEADFEQTQKLSADLEVKIEILQEELSKGKPNTKN